MPFEPNTEITRERFLEVLADGATRRVCFKTSHANALKAPSHPTSRPGAFNLPFAASIGPIFERVTGLRLWSNQRDRYNPAAVWRSVKTAEEHQIIADFLRAMGDRLFLRDALSLSVALGPHQEVTDRSGRHRTELGELEYRAKWQRCAVSIQKLVEHCVTAIRALPYYRDATYITAVPPGPDKTWDLPSRLVAGISTAAGLIDVTPLLTWRGTKPPVKSLAAAEKWQSLEAVGLEVGADLRGCDVILVDDLYQSGSTMNFVGSCLHAAGARYVFGLSLSKSLRDSDNL